MRKRIISVVLIVCLCICTLGNYSVVKADEGQTADLVRQLTCSKGVGFVR